MSKHTHTTNNPMINRRAVEDPNDQNRGDACPPALVTQRVSSARRSNRRGADLPRSLHDRQISGIARSGHGCIASMRSNRTVRRYEIDCEAMRSDRPEMADILPGAMRGSRFRCSSQVPRGLHRSTSARWTFGARSRVTARRSAATALKHQRRSRARHGLRQVRASSRQVVRTINSASAATPGAFDRSVVEGLGLVFNRNGRTNEKQPASACPSCGRGRASCSAGGHPRTHWQPEEALAAAAVIEVFNKSEAPHSKTSALVVERNRSGIDRGCSWTVNGRPAFGKCSPVSMIRGAESDGFRHDAHGPGPPRLVSGALPEDVQQGRCGLVRCAVAASRADVRLLVRTKASPNRRCRPMRPSSRATSSEFGPAQRGGGGLGRLRSLERLDAQGPGHRHRARSMTATARAHLGESHGGSAVSFYQMADLYSEGGRAGAGRPASREGDRRPRRLHRRRRPRGRRAA